MRPQLPRQPQVVPPNDDDEDFMPVPRVEPLSFEQALAMGRGMGGRQLPSPMPNGYKPGQPGVVDPNLAPTERRLPTRRLRPVPANRPLQQQGAEERHSDSDEDDWC